MAERPAGIRAILDAFDNGDLDAERCARSTGRSISPSAAAATPTTFPEAERLAAMFPDFTIETFPERHHFDPPHRVEPERLPGRSLALWQRAEQ